MLIKLKASPYKEAHEVAEKMTNELRQVIPAFVKRSHNERGEGYVDYLNKTVHELRKKVSVKKAKNQLFKAGNEVKLVYSDPHPDIRVIAALQYPHSSLSMNELVKQVRGMSDRRKKQIFKAITGHRIHRTHKVPRGFEHTQFTFDITSDIGAYRDLQRHRMLTQQRQPYTTKLGYIIPAELEQYPELKKRYVTALTQAAELHEKMCMQLPLEAQYIVPFGFRIRYSFHLNLREAIHLTELRSTSQGHPSYRMIAQEMAKQIIKKVPLFADLFPFVDYKSYELERLKAFQRVAAKAKKAGITVFED